MRNVTQSFSDASSRMILYFLASMMFSRSKNRDLSFAVDRVVIECTARLILFDSWQEDRENIILPSRLFAPKSFFSLIVIHEYSILAETLKNDLQESRLTKSSFLL